MDDYPVLAGINVLVVDDQPDAQELLSIVLEQYGARAKAVGSAAEALAEVRRQPPDLVLSDISMPDEDGYSLIRKIRQLGPERGGSVPAMAITAYADREDRRRALAAGFQEHVTKPVEPEALVSTIARLTTRSRIEA